MEKTLVELPLDLKKKLNVFLNTSKYIINSAVAIEKEKRTSTADLHNILKEQININKSVNNKLHYVHVKPVYNDICNIIKKYIQGELKLSGNNLYPNPGWMNWHTNNNYPGTRCYFTYVKDINKSCFKYYNLKEKKVITDVDNSECILRKFVVNEDNPFWHCVESNTTRLSIGFHVT